ncbi:MAG: Ig-like domain-containing protein [Gemmatimonadetes bacterium]|nr:Ig-like domain-containing protein [Gemmatimonadota bacterium]
MAGVVIAVSCARALPPPGGEEDRQPPRVVATVPEPLALAPDFDGAVVFRFDERISERGVDDNSVLVSPRTGEVRVSRGRTEIRVEVEGGWRSGTIYRVILVPGIRDLFGNETRVPAELAFSTGPELPQTVIGGLVSDRITGRPATLVMVEATPRGDSTTYITAADSAAFFSFRYLPPAFYDIVAWTDQNRNRRRDPAEAYSRSTGVPVNRDTDTLVVENLAIVPADTTPPRLTRAEARDSTSVRITADDWLEPTADLQFLEVTLITLPDSVAIPGPHRLMTVDSFTVMERLRADSAAADSAAADTIAAARPPPGRTTAARPPATPPAQAGIPAPALPLPYQELVLIPVTPLAPGQRYRMTIQGLVNISARSGPPVSIEFTVPERRPVRPDTTNTIRPLGPRPAMNRGTRGM